MTFQVWNLFLIDVLANRIILTAGCNWPSIFYIFLFNTFFIHIKLVFFCFEWFFVFIFYNFTCSWIEALTTLYFFIVIMNLLFENLIHILCILRLNIKTLMLLVLNIWALLIFINASFISYIIFRIAFKINNRWKKRLSFFVFLYINVFSIAVFLFL